MNRSSSAAPGLKLKQEQVHDGLNSLELRLGISSDNGSSPWLGVGVDPWSLAARQEKAALEQAHQRPHECALQRESGVAAPQLVGWPPVRAFRKNLSAAPRPADAAEVKPGSDDDGDGHGGGERPAATSMFVKVNLEGCAVGRKVDLQAHRGYASLSRALQSMFRGFLSEGQWRIAAKEEDGDIDDEQQQQEETTMKGARKTYILLYEDNEGDRMLVGDVPWELFISSVKRLYIAQDPREMSKSS